METRFFTIGLKLIGVYCLIHSLDFVTYIVIGPVGWQFMTRADYLIFASGIVPLALLWTTAYVLLWRTEAVVEKLWRGAASDVPSAQAQTVDWLPAIFMTVGLLLLVWNIPGYIARLVVNLLVSIPKDMEPAVLMQSQVDQGSLVVAITIAVHLVVGLYLIVGAHRLAQGLRRYVTSDPIREGEPDRGT